ncbi:MAG: enoyl-CoA hydratase-related protein [Actinomycetota bacterium]|nr:enoyl-CoA hydratase-related protein [Actinomycetota bacterium]
MCLLLSERRDRVAVLTFNDPDRRNAISAEMNLALDETFDDLESDEDVGAVVLIGAGRAFCAGAVIDDLLGAGESEERSKEVPSLYSGFLRVAHSPLATVAAVNGSAVGAGMNMLLACDLVVAGRSAKFDSRFLSIGLHPGGGHIWRLRHLTNLGTTRAMVLFQQVLDGEEAARRGLAWECVDDEALLDAAVAYADLAAAHPRELVASTKASIAAGLAVTDSEEAVQLEIAPQIRSMHQPAFLEMIRALKERISSRG